MSNPHVFTVHTEFQFNGFFIGRKRGERRKGNQGVLKAHGINCAVLVNVHNTGKEREKNLAVTQLNPPSLFSGLNLIFANFL